jgi:hypothetical protein
VSGSLLIRLAKWEVILFVGGLAAIVGYKLLTGGINTRYLLYGTRPDGTRYFSPERVQLLVATLAIAAQYLLAASHTDSHSLPTLPGGTLQLLGLSNSVYLGGKAWNTFKKANDN